jgi:Ni,Fe-hydrogenase I cytochrome b subunit
MSEYIRILNTLAAYVSVVWNVARGSWLVVDDEGAYCVHCDEEAWIDEIVDYIRKYACNHAPGCPYAQARKLLGLD